MTDPAALPSPGADLRDAWRAAVLAYRRMRQRGELDHPAYLATIDAYLAVRPEDGREEAGRPNVMGSLIETEDGRVLDGPFATRGEALAEVTRLCGEELAAAE